MTHKMATKTSIHAKAQRDQTRLSCRVSARIKQQVEEAAALLGQSITDFTESALAEKAQAVLDHHERIVLSDRDFARFVELVESPKSPTAALRSAMSEYSALSMTHPASNL